VKKKIIIGTWPLSGDYGKQPLKDTFKLFEYCIEKKLHEFDTAPSYGNGFIEHILGSVFMGCKNIKINTKFGNLPFYGKNFKLDFLERSFFESLSRLKLDKINTLFIHNPRLNDNEIMRILNLQNKLKKQNLINYTGISLAKDFQYKNHILKKFDVVQDDANVLFMRYKIFPNSINFHARSPLASGILSNRFSINKKYSKQDQRSQWLNDYKRKKTILKCIEFIKKTSGSNIKKNALNFLFSDSKINKIIFGARNVQQLRYIYNFKIKKHKKISNILVKGFLNNFGLKKKDLIYFY